MAVVGTAAGFVGGRITSAPAVPAPLTQVLLFVALVLAGRLTVAYRHRGEVDALDVFEAALTPAVALLPGLRLVLLVAVAKIAAQLWLRMPAPKLAFNVAQWTACTGLACLAYAALSGPDASVSARIPALVIAMVIVAVVNLASLAALFALLPAGPAPGRIFQGGQLARSSAMTAVTVATGVATALAADENSGALVALFGLLLLLHWAGRGYSLQGKHSDRTRWLQSATHTLSASVDPRESLPAFLADVCRCCKAESAELVLRRSGPIELFRAGVPLSSPPATELLNAELPLHVVAIPKAAAWRVLAARFTRHAREPQDDAAAAVRTAGWRDCLAVPVLNDELRVGVLAVYNRTGLAELDAADLTALQAMAHELSTALQRAELIQQAMRARERAERIIAGSNDGIVAIGEDGSVVAWNPALAEMTGRPAAEAVGAPVSVLDARDAAAQPVRLEAWVDDRELPAELQIRSVDGRRRWVSCSYAQEADRRRGGRMLVVMVRDITELRRHRALTAGQAQILELIASDEPATTSLQAIAELIADQFDGAGVCVLAVDENGGDGPVLAVSDTPADAVSDAVRPDLTGSWLDLQAQQRPDGHPLVLTDTTGPNELTYWAMPVAQDEDAQPRAVILVRPHPATPVSEYAVEVLRTAARLTDVCLSRDEARARLAHQASHDPLTGLPNRVLFLERCLHALRARPHLGRSVVVLFVDLDQFKVVNDSLGHDVGDRLLIAVAERLRHALRPADTIARFGGDEFTILCEAIRDDDARILAERLLALFDNPFRIDDIEVFETASIGIAVATRTSRPVDLLQQADTAMYRAKDGGGNRYAFFDSRIGRRASARLASYTGLRRAVDEGQFKVFYQPMVSLEDGSLAGMEALVRWQHPRGELLPPRHFIDLAEETGLIVPLGAFVLRTALLEMPRLSLGGVQPARISVNVSARQLASPQFLATVRHALDDSGVAPHRLSLEITESVLLTRSSAVYGVINDLKSIGVGLSLDDFGTGHSSLDYLRRVPVDELKVDRRFIAELTTSDQSRAIVAAVISLAHDLGLRVVAEGIEHAAQVTSLAELRCDLAQGFFYSPPLPGEELLDVVAAESA